MRLPLLLIVTVVLLSAAPIRWHGDYDGAFAEAKRTHKPLLLFLTQPHCRTCAYMKKDVLTDPAVASFVNAHFVAAELGMQDNGLPKRYRVQVSPVFTFIDPQEDEIIEQIQGGRKPDRFLDTLESVIDDYSDSE